MLIGGTLTLTLTIFSDENLPFEVPYQFTMPYGLDPIIFGITASALAFIVISLITKEKTE